MHNFFLENSRNPARARRAGATRQFRSGQLNSTKCTNYLDLVGYYILDRWGTGALRPRCALARDFVNFENNFMHRARAARPHGFDSLPSLDPNPLKIMVAQLCRLLYSCRSTKFRIWIQVKLEKIAKLNVISRDLRRGGRHGRENIE